MREPTRSPKGSSKPDPPQDPMQRRYGRYQHYYNCHRNDYKCRACRENGVTAPKGEGMKATRAEVYEAIDGERAFHSSRYPRGEKQEFSIGEELLLIEEYASRARKRWIRETQGEAPETLNTIRKIAGLAVRCLEKHGAPKRQP